MKTTSLLAALCLLFVFSSCGKEEVSGRDLSSAPQYFKDGAGLEVQDEDSYEAFVKLGVPEKPLKQASE